MKGLLAEASMLFVAVSLVLAFPFLSERNSLDMNVSVVGKDSVGHQVTGMTLKVENREDRRIDPVFMAVNKGNPDIWRSNSSAPLEPGETRTVRLELTRYSRPVQLDRKFMIQVVDNGTQERYKKVVELGREEVPPSYVHVVGNLPEWPRTVLKSDRMNLAMEIREGKIDLQFQNRGDRSCGVKYVARTPLLSDRIKGTPLEIEMWFVDANRSYGDISRDKLRRQEKVIVAEPGENVSETINYSRIFTYFNDTMEKMSLASLTFAGKRDTCAGEKEEISSHVGEE